MRVAQEIFRTRREYNTWVGNETLEDYALRFTAIKARRWSSAHVGKTALGATAFLALEAIAATVTLNYGFTNAVLAMFTVAALIFVIGFPIAYQAARHGLDIDLLTRGAGFGYLGSTVTSLIYASFTYIFFAIEAAILASALQALFGIPLAVGYVISALAVIPIVTHGITAISKFQIGTQSTWLILQCTALAVVTYAEFDKVSDWTQYMPAGIDKGPGFDLILFGASASILFAMVAQIGEQVDYLRFMPPKTLANRRSWWFWLVLAGPGWIFIGLIKMLLGSFLAYLAITKGFGFEQAIDPTHMYQMVFNYLVQSPTLALVLAALMVVISQLKINVTNAYAGSIAWSNFFSRLTHSHPGRVVWLVFNVAIALILMELGIYQALEAILGLFAIVALSWLSCLAADLLINKPLGLSPSYIEFKRAHLYDINPVGVYSMLIASVIGIMCYLGSFGESAKYLSHFISIVSCFITVPLIAGFTGGRFYLTEREPEMTGTQSADNIPVSGKEAVPDSECCICQNEFEPDDMSYCPAYRGAICSLCCSLDTNCMDVCRPGARISEQIISLFTPLFPHSIQKIVNSKLTKFMGLLLASNGALAIVLALTYFQMQPQTTAEVLLLRQAMITLFFVLLIVFGVMSWLFLLAHESRIVARNESTRQNMRLTQEVEAHNETDKLLQQAKELAERANSAKSRYLTGISHELRSPLQAVLGYAQLLVQRPDMPVQHHKALQTIKRSGDHLAGLIEGLLDISKIEAGRLDIYKNQFYFPEFIEQLAFMFKEQASLKGIEFNCSIQSRLPDFVATDEKRLRQILINLLSNAIKYTNEGRVDFTIKYRNQVAEFSIIDTGVGIASEDLQRILDPFERVRNPNVPNVSGTGLGLTIARLLTEIMGGELKISSQPGSGSCFTVSLMIPWQASPVDKSLPSQVVTGFEGDSRTVLVVDDEPIHRGLMSDLLTPLGFNLLEAHDAESCYEQLRVAVPDLFLLDVSMPGKDGLTLAKELRGLGYKIPIIMISADAQERHESQRENNFHDGYLVKPINNQMLIDRIGQLLDLRWQVLTNDKQAQTSIPKQPELKPEFINHSLYRELLNYASIGYKHGVENKIREIESAELLDETALLFYREITASMRFDKLVDSLTAEDRQASRMN